jgi:hypothetical protein
VARRRAPQPRPNGGGVELDQSDARAERHSATTISLRPTNATGTRGRGAMAGPYELPHPRSTHPWSSCTIGTGPTCCSVAGGVYSPAVLRLRDEEAEGPGPAPSTRPTVAPSLALLKTAGRVCFCSHEGAVPCP